jgi:hypothetical protein
MTVNGLRFLLIVLTGVAIPLMLIAATGRGTITVNGVLDAPYTLEFDDGRSIGVNGTADLVTYQNFEVGLESETLSTAPTVTAPLEVSRNDTNSRVVVMAMFAGWLGIAWIGLENLRRLVRSAVARNPFAAENPGRLRWLGGAILAVPVVTGVGNAILARTIDVGLPFSVSVDRSGWLVLIVVGVGLFALAEVFGEAVRLREFEESTI